MSFAVCWKCKCETNDYDFKTIEVKRNGIFISEAVPVCRECYMQILIEEKEAELEPVMKDLKQIDLRRYK